MNTSANAKSFKKFAKTVKKIIKEQRSGNNPHIPPPPDGNAHESHQEPHPVDQDQPDLQQTDDQLLANKAATIDGSHQKPKSQDEKVPSEPPTEGGPPQPEKE